MGATPQPLRARFQALGLAQLTDAKVEAAPRALRALLEGGRAALARNDAASARQALIEVQRMAPDLAAVHLSFAELWVHEGNLERALVELQTARRSAPGDVALARLVERANALQKAPGLRTRSAPPSLPVTPKPEAACLEPEASFSADEKTQRISDAELAHVLRLSEPDLDPEVPSPDPEGRPRDSQHHHAGQDPEHAAVPAHSEAAGPPRKALASGRGSRSGGRVPTVAWWTVGAILCAAWALLRPSERPQPTLHAATAAPNHVAEPASAQHRASTWTPAPCAPNLLAEPVPVPRNEPLRPEASAEGVPQALPPGISPGDAVTQARAALATQSRPAWERARRALSDEAGVCCAPGAPADVESRALGLRLALRLGDDGKNLFGAARALCGESARHPAALRALLEIAAATGKTRETADALGELALRSALQGDDLYVLAQWHAAEGDFARAEVHADNLLESMPEHEPGRHLRAELLLHQGRFVAAAAAFESIARRLEGSLTESPLGPANRAMPCPRPPDLPEQVSSNAPAPAEVRQIRQVQLPSSTRRLLRSTYLAWASAQYELEPKSALPILERLDSLAAGEPGTAVLRARVELSEGRPEEALHRLAGSSADAGVLAARGDALVALGHVHSARASYLRALRSQPAFAGALVGLGEIELRRAHPLTARSFLRQAEEAFGNSRAEQRLYARLMTALGAAYLQSPDASYLTAATTALHAATELPGAPPEAFYWLGTALHRAGAAGHRAALTHFLELAPDSPSSASAQRLLDAPSAAE